MMEHLIYQMFPLGTYENRYNDDWETIFEKDQCLPVIDSEPTVEASQMFIKPKFVKKIQSEINSFVTALKQFWNDLI